MDRRIVVPPRRFAGSCHVGWRPAGRCSPRLLLRGAPLDRVNSLKSKHKDDL
jgi:hypothetical protein